MDSGDIVLLTDLGVFTDDTDISLGGEIDWFKFQADDGYYELNWQDSSDPVSSSMTCDVKVTAYKADGTLISGPIDNGMSDGLPFDKDSDIYIKVEGKNADSTGTYSLFFS